MRGRWNPIASLLALFLLVGCAGANGPERWKSLPEAQRAVIFGTVTAYESGLFLSTSRLHFRNIETGETAMIAATPGNDITGNPDLYERDKMKVWSFELAVPPGRYEFFSYSATRNMGQFGSTQYHAKQDFSVPFVVEAGKTHYLGEYRAFALMGRNVFGMKLAEGGYFVLVDNQERDTALLAKKRNGSIEGPIINIVPKPDPSNPFVRLAPYSE